MIPHGPLAALIALFDGGCVLVIGIAAYASLVAIADGVRDMPWRRRRRYRGLGALMDTGDGQGGVPPLPREQPPDPAIAAGVEYLLLRDGDGTRSWRDLIVPSPRMERLCCGRCRTGNGHLPCNCAVDCYAVVCLQWDAVSEVRG